MKGVIAWLVKNHDLAEYQIVYNNPYDYYTFVKKIVYFEVEED